MRNFIFLSFLIAFNPLMANDFKVGVVNIQKVITTINAGKKILGELQKSFDSKQKIIRSEEESIKKLQEDYQKKSALMSQDAKIKAETEIRQKMAALQQKTMKYQKEMQQQEAELKRPLLEKLKPVIDDIASKEKLDLAFEISTSPLVYARSQVDITEKVIKAYDKKYK